MKYTKTVATLKYPFELIVADLDIDKIKEVRNTWRFFRDKRPDSYGSLVAD